MANNIGFDPSTNDYQRIHVTNNAQNTTEIRSSLLTLDFLYRALAGEISGVRRVVFSGFNTDIDTATTPEDIWFGGGLIPVPSAAESWEIVSSSADDSAAGTGARTVSLTTLDGTYAEVTQTVTLNGITAVPLTGTHRFINIGRILTTGSTGLLQGNLTIRVAGGGATRAFITTPEGVLNQAKFTVPTGFTLDILSILFGMRTLLGNEGAVVNSVTTLPNGTVLQPIRISLFAAGVSLYRHEVAGGLVPLVSVPAQTSFGLRASAVTQNNTAVDVAGLGILYADSARPV